MAPLVLAVVVIGAMTVRDEVPRPASPVAEPPEVAGAEAVAFAPPVPMVPGEAFVRTRVLVDGTLRTSHWVVTQRPVTTLSLAEPEVPTTAGEVEATSVRVVADGVTIPGPAAVSGERVDFRFDPSDELRVDYVLRGVTQRNGSVPGRALTHAAGLVVGTDEEPVRITHSIGGVEVLSVACGSQGTAMTPCGRVEDGVWYVDIDGRTPAPVIVAQVDLPLG